MVDLQLIHPVEEINVDSRSTRSPDRIARTIPVGNKFPSDWSPVDERRKNPMLGRSMGSVDLESMQRHQ